MGDENQSAIDLLVNEIEVLFAQRMAFWGKGKTDFCKRVYEAEPLTLFLAALVELKKEIRKLPLDVREHGYQGFSQIIDETVHTLEEASDWPETVPLIADLI